LLAAQTIAYLDAICSLADIADEFNYNRPIVNETSLLRIKNGRHAVVENILRRKQIEFVANDSALGGNGAPQIALITGPNASGKSTYLRQIALIVLLAQIGSFVPADEAVVGVCDRIFTRIGLYDRIGAGESTFMTEMIETAEILHHATARSLILLDELGRGTSTSTVWRSRARFWNLFTITRNCKRGRFSPRIITSSPNSKSFAASRQPSLFNRGEKRQFNFQIQNGNAARR
jgi:DNA mismatch repair protein MutS